MNRLDLSTKTLFAEFQETVFARSAIQETASSSQIYVRKTVKGKSYWYLQRYEDNQSKQTYFGPSNAKNDSFVEKEKKKHREGGLALKKMIGYETRQMQMLKKSGIPVVEKRIADMLRILSEAQLTDRFGVLVGTLAFTAYAGMLGYLFDRSTLMTQDIDIARDEKIVVAAPTIDIDQVFSRSNIAFRRVPAFSKTAASSSFVTEDGLRIDMLVPLIGKEKKNVKMPHVIGAGAVQLRFLDFLIKDAERTVILCGNGGITVTVPSPERYAVHKLIVASYRPATETAKKEKDLHQAKVLISILKEERPHELKSAFSEAKRSGKKWERAIGRSLEMISN